MPCLLAVYGRPALFRREMEELGQRRQREVTGQTGRTGGRRNCKWDEKIVKKNTFLKENTLTDNRKNYSNDFSNSAGVYNSSDYRC